jgi:hypothetical protein
LLKRWRRQVFVLGVAAGFGAFFPLFFVWSALSDNGGLGVVLALIASGLIGVAIVRAMTPRFDPPPIPCPVCSAPVRPFKRDASGRWVRVEACAQCGAALPA